MTTQRQIKILVQPLLERHPDLAFAGGLLVVKPVEHLLRFVLVDRTGTGNVFNPRWAMTFLFGKRDDLPIGLGELIYPFGPYIPGLWQWSDPEAAERFVGRVEAVALPKLRAIRSLQNYLDFALPREPEGLQYTFWMQFWFSIAMGNLATARGLAIEMPRAPALRWLNENHDGLGTRIAEQGEQLALHDREALAKQLHDWEADTVDKLELAGVWQPTPFPLELQAATESTLKT